MKYKLPFIFVFGIIIWLCIPLSKSYAQQGLGANAGGFTRYFFCKVGDNLYQMYGFNSNEDISAYYYNNSSSVGFNFSRGNAGNHAIYSLWLTTPNGNVQNGTIEDFLTQNTNNTLYGYSYTWISYNFPVPIYNQSVTWYPTYSYDINPYVNNPIPEPVEPPVNIALCAFFFEPEPGTDLYSMYCFPQELDDNEVVTIYYNNLNNTGFEITSASVDTLKRCYLESGSTIEYYHSIDYWLEMIDQVELEADNVIDFLFTTPIYAVYCDFIENNGNPNYNIFPLTEESWWDDIVNMIGFEDTELGFIWEWLFGDPDPDYHNVTIDNSPSPTPLPTPKPYRTTLVPDGNGGYEFQYEYEDENGNTITASAPPEQPNYDGNALITQPVNMNISGIPVSDVEGVQSLLNVIGEADQEYQEGFQVIGKSFATLPTKWFMFFGIPAAIILIAGIIKSLLG